MRTIVPIVTIVLTSACSSSTAPHTAPASTAPVAIASVPEEKPAAELEITTFEMNYLREEFGQHVYAPEIILTEKSGRSPAQLKSIDLRMPNGFTNRLGGPCPNNLEVPRAGIWTLTHLAFWCRDVDSPEDISGLPVTVTIVYADENGVTGQLASTAVAEAVR
jgi:hypothetical protein